VARREEAVEMGGYFICNGIERIIRLLVQQRRHYIMALRRGAFRKRGSNYTDLGTLIRRAHCRAATLPGHQQPRPHKRFSDYIMGNERSWSLLCKVVIFGT